MIRALFTLQLLWSALQYSIIGKYTVGLCCKGAPDLFIPFPLSAVCQYYMLFCCCCRGWDRNKWHFSCVTYDTNLSLNTFSVLGLTSQFCWNDSRYTPFAPWFAHVSAHRAVCKLLHSKFWILPTNKPLNTLFLPLLMYFLLYKVPYRWWKESI